MGSSGACTLQTHSANVRPSLGFWPCYKWRERRREQAGSRHAVIGLESHWFLHELWSDGSPSKGQTEQQRSDRCSTRGRGRREEETEPRAARCTGGANTLLAMTRLGWLVVLLSVLVDADSSKTSLLSSSPPSPSSMKLLLEMPLDHRPHVVESNRWGGNHSEVVARRLEAMEMHQVLPACSSCAFCRTSSEIMCRLAVSCCGDERWWWWWWW